MKPRRPKVFDDILYAQCWEDPELDRAAFSIASDDVVFSITSGGCNVLTFLLDNPRKVIALDVNPYQNFLLDLKMAAFKRLSYLELLEFVGVRESDNRMQLYNKLRPALHHDSRSYWDTQSRKIQHGILHCGRYERYMGLLRRWVNRLMGRALVRKFFETEDPAARGELFRTEWRTIWWWLFTRVLLSRFTMTLLFDKAFFRYLDGSFSFGKHFAERVRRALTELPTKENYFLSYILLGRYYSEDHLPPYLREQNYHIIRSRLNRIEPVCDSCEHFFSTLPDSCITKFNFTNIFEWISPEEYERLLRQTHRVARNGAVLTYRNLLVFRERPIALAAHIRSLHMKARSLHERDLSFIYRNYVVEAINKRSAQWDTSYIPYLTAEH